MLTYLWYLCIKKKKKWNSVISITHFSSNDWFNLFKISHFGYSSKTQTQLSYTQLSKAILLKWWIIHFTTWCLQRPRGPGLSFFMVMPLEFKISHNSQKVLCQTFETLIFTVLCLQRLRRPGLIFIIMTPLEFKILLKNVA